MLLKFIDEISTDLQKNYKLFRLVVTCDRSRVEKHTTEPLHAMLNNEVKGQDKVKSKVKNKDQIHIVKVKGQM